MHKQLTQILLSSKFTLTSKGRHQMSTVKDEKLLRRALLNFRLAMDLQSQI